MSKNGEKEKKRKQRQERSFEKAAHFTLCKVEDQLVPSGSTEISAFLEDMIGNQVTVSTLDFGILEAFFTMGFSISPETEILCRQKGREGMRMKDA